MQFSIKFLCLTLLLIMPNSAAPQTWQSSDKARELPGLDEGHAFWKARARPNILLIVTDDQGICSDSMITVQKLTYPFKTCT